MMSTPTDDIEAKAEEWVCMDMDPALDYPGAPISPMLAAFHRFMQARSLAHPPTSEIAEAIPVRQAIRIVQQWIIDRDLAMNQGRNTFDMLKARMEGYLRSVREEAQDAAPAHPKEVAPTVEETVDELMAFLEDYIEEGIEEMHDHSSDHGWQYDRGHPNWDKAMNDLRTRLTKLLTTP